LPPTSPLFPYTTLFRSRGGQRRVRAKNRHVQPPLRALPAEACRFAVQDCEVIEQIRREENERDGQRRQHQGDVESFAPSADRGRSEEHTSELQSLAYLV